MAFNPFIGWSREDLETELRSAQEDYAAGKSATRSGAGDAMSESRIESAPLERIKQLLRALNAIAPADYPIASITGNDRTRGVFWSRCNVNGLEVI